MAEKFERSKSAIEALINNTQAEITQHTRDTAYNDHIQFILESAKFRMDSLEHSVDQYNRQTFEYIESRLEQIIYQTEQELLELKLMAGKNTNSFYDEFARGLDNS